MGFLFLFALQATFLPTPASGLKAMAQVEIKQEEKSQPEATGANDSLLAPAGRILLKKYCLDCHDAGTSEGGLNLESLLDSPVARHPATWEKAVRKLSVRHMPPLDAERPAPEEFEALLQLLIAPLDAAAERKPDPGPSLNLRRLNRTEYQNAIRDLLALDLVHLRDEDAVRLPQHHDGPAQGLGQFHDLNRASPMGQTANEPTLFQCGDQTVNT